nr:MAG TPA: NinB recombination protein [Caudoviricetes sp.]
MLYNLSSQFEAQQARTRLEMLIKRGCIIELTEKKPRRSLQANKYLHVILAYFASQIGETTEYVKQKYYKALVNPQTFIREREDRFLGKVRYLRSSADLDSAEFALTIDRFRNWASMEVGIYIPSPDEDRLIQLMEIEAERNNRFL